MISKLHELISLHFAKIVFKSHHVESILNYIFHHIKVDTNMTGWLHMEPDLPTWKMFLEGYFP